MEDYISWCNINKSFYGDGVVISDLNLSITKHEFFVLLGPSGSGKTTLLLMTAGIMNPDSGNIMLGGVDITDLPPHKNPCGMMFQSFSLFPHMDSLHNVMFGLEQSGMPYRQAKKEAFKMMDLLSITNIAYKKPHQLSGGEKQRVAMARALKKSNTPKAFLLDEPTANLDDSLEQQVWLEMINLQEILEMPFVVVTHSQREALALATEMAVMDHRGFIAQKGKPWELYECPRNLYVANFMGDNLNVFSGIITDLNGDSVSVSVDCFSGKKWIVPKNVFAHAPFIVGQKVFLGLRPEKIGISLQEQEGDIVGTVDEISYLGNMSMYHIRTLSLADNKTMYVAKSNETRLIERPITWGDTVYLAWKTNSLMLLEK